MRAWPRSRSEPGSTRARRPTSPRWWCGWPPRRPPTVTGRVFNVKGGAISVAETWVAGPGVRAKHAGTPEELGERHSRASREGAAQLRRGRAAPCLTESPSRHRSRRPPRWSGWTGRTAGTRSSRRCRPNCTVNWSCSTPTRSIRAIVVTGRGRLFSTGADMEPGGAISPSTKSNTGRARAELAARPRPWRMRTPDHRRAERIGRRHRVDLPDAVGHPHRQRGGQVRIRVHPAWPHPGTELAVAAAAAGRAFGPAVELLLTGRIFTGAEAKDYWVWPPRPARLRTCCRGRWRSPTRSRTTPRRQRSGSPSDSLYEMLGETDRESAFYREWEAFRWVGASGRRRRGRGVIPGQAGRRTSPSPNTFRYRVDRWLEVAMMTDTVLYDVDDQGVVLLTLSRPDRRNMWTAQMEAEFYDCARSRRRRRAACASSSSPARETRSCPASTPRCSPTSVQASPTPAIGVRRPTPPPCPSRSSAPSTGLVRESDWPRR